MDGRVQSIWNKQFKVGDVVSFRRQPCLILEISNKSKLNKSDKVYVSWHAVWNHTIFYRLLQGDDKHWWVSIGHLKWWAKKGPNKK